MNFSSRRPADLRGARHALASSALESANNKAKAAASPPSKKRKTTASSSRRKRKAASARADEKLDAYHYIGYVPAHGRVWELDGLRTAGPLDVGEIDSDDPTSRAGWMDVVRPALQRRMQTVLQSGAEHIQYNLLAIVDDQYLRASDELEMLKRERAAIERRLAQSCAEGWTDKVRGCPPAPRGSVAEALTPPSIAQVDSALLASASEAFATTLRPRAQEAGKVFAPDFGARKMEKELAILDMPERKLAPAWEDCVRAALSAKVAVEEETEKSRRAQVRAFSAPFVCFGSSRMRCVRRSTSTEVHRGPLYYFPRPGRRPALSTWLAICCPCPWLRSPFGSLQATFAPK